MFSDSRYRVPIAVIGLAMVSLVWGCTAPSTEVAEPPAELTPGEGAVTQASASASTQAAGDIADELEAMKARMQALRDDMEGMGASPSRERMGTMMDGMLAMMRDMQSMLDRSDLEAMDPHHMQTMQEMMGDMESMGGSLRGMMEGGGMGDMMSGGMDMGQMMSGMAAMHGQLDEASPADDEHHPTATPATAAPSEGDPVVM